MLHFLTNLSAFMCLGYERLVSEISTSILIQCRWMKFRSWCSPTALKNVIFIDISLQNQCFCYSVFLGTTFYSRYKLIPLKTEQKEKCCCWISQMPLLNGVSTKNKKTFTSIVFRKQQKSQGCISNNLDKENSNYVHGWMPLEVSEKCFSVIWVYRPFKLLQLPI